MFEPSTETMSRAALTRLQTTRLKQTLDNAYPNVCCYRKKFDAAGVKPADFKSLADLARFPFTLKTDLRDNYPFGMFAVPRDKVIRSMPRRERRASRPSSVIPRATSTAGGT